MRDCWPAYAGQPLLARSRPTATGTRRSSGPNSLQGDPHAHRRRGRGAAAQRRECPRTDGYRRARAWVHRYCAIEHAPLSPTGGNTNDKRASRAGSRGAGDCACAGGDVGRTPRSAGAAEEAEPRPLDPGRRGRRPRDHRRGAVTGPEALRQRWCGGCGSRGRYVASRGRCGRLGGSVSRCRCSSPARHSLIVRCGASRSSDYSPRRLPE